MENLFIFAFMKKIILLLAITLVLGSCATKEDVIYFQDIDNASLGSVSAVYEHPEIQVNDILKIDLSALNPKSLVPYQFEKTAEGTPSRASQTELLKLEGYLVTEAGFIKYPGVGKLKVIGKTTQEVEELLESEIGKYVKNVTARVRLVNFKVTVIGEVKQPGTYTVSESISLPQALGLAGDLTIQGSRENVLVIRQKGDSREKIRLDLTQSNWMDTPYYFLQQNDIVYVKPNTAKVKSAGIVGNLGTVLSVVSILLSAAVIIFR